MSSVDQKGTPSMSTRLPWNSCGGTYFTPSRYLQYLNEREPGLNVKMSTAVRMLIVRGLDQLEKEIGPLPPPSRGKR